MINKIAMFIILATILFADPTKPCINPFKTVDWSTFFDELKWKGFCICKSDEGLPRFGIPGKIHMAEPIGFIEFSNTPWRFPCLGISMGSDNPTKMGTSSTGDTDSAMRVTAHYIKYPVFAIIGYLSDSLCQTRFPSSMDFGYFGEISPGWQSDIFAAMEMPDGLAFSNPIAAFAALPDCVATTAGHPINYLYYNAGCLGHIGVSTGHTYGNDPIAESMLLGAKIINNMHAGFELMKTSDAEGLPNTNIEGTSLNGGDSMCKPQIFPRIIKSQYLMNLSYPTVEDAKEIGTMAILWAQFKNMVNTQDDAVLTVWRRRDCCAGIYIYSSNGN
jgi:conjugal transfer pilus assembly protein TraU